jgi:tetraacyldisaccharide 4'-kinase
LNRLSYQALVSGQTRGFWAALQRGGLWLASVPYGLAVRLRNRLYDGSWKRRHRAAVPVVSVGNLTLGGTGKTPCVEYVARYYRRLDRRVAILSRGYGGGGGPNDEALLLEENLPDVPHLQGADRVALAQIAVEELESEVLILDDGFQHRRLERTLDLVLVDATNPWGHGYLFPRGLLREPRSSLRRAGVVLLTRCDQVSVAERDRLRQEVGRLAPGISMVETTHAPAVLVNSDRIDVSLETLHDRPVAAFSGIGNPASFRRTLASLGARMTDYRVFPDHHAYTRADVEELRTWARQQPAEGIVVTTQKDLAKLRLTQLGGRPLWALRIHLRIAAGQEVLDRRLQEVLSV